MVVMVNKAENKFWESYGKETSESLAGTIPKGVPPYVRYTKEKIKVN